MANKIKVALIIRGFHSGGIEKVFETYYSHMDLSPYEIHIVTNMKNMADRQEIFEKMGCIVHPLSPMSGHRMKWKNIKEYKKLFKEESFDVVHNNVPDNLIPLFFAKRYGVPVRILHAHNMYTEDFSTKNRIVAVLFRKGFVLNASNATKLVAVSGLAAEAAFAEKRGEATILKNAINLDKFAFDKNARAKIKNQLGITDKEVLFGHIGRYENNQKNQEFVLTLFRKVVDEYDNCKLVMIGEGVRRGEFMDMAKSLQISEKVVFTGAVPNVNEYLSAMDIYLFPSRKEGFGIAGVEAQTSGVKCIFSDKIPEEARVTNDLIVLEMKGEQAVSAWMEQVERLLPTVLMRGESERRSTLEQVKAAGFDIRTQVKKLEALYQEVIL